MVRLRDARQRTRRRRGSHRAGCWRPDRLRRRHQRSAAGTPVPRPAAARHRGPPVSRALYPWSQVRVLLWPRQATGIVGARATRGRRVPRQRINPFSRLECARASARVNRARPSCRGRAPVTASESARSPAVSAASRSPPSSVREVTEVSEQLDPQLDGGAFARRSQGEIDKTPSLGYAPGQADVPAQRSQPTRDDGVGRVPSVRERCPERAVAADTTVDTAHRRASSPTVGRWPFGYHTTPRCTGRRANMVPNTRPRPASHGGDAVSRQDRSARITPHTTKTGLAAAMSGRRSAPTVDPVPLPGE